MDLAYSNFLQIDNAWQVSFPLNRNTALINYVTEFF